MADDIDTLSLSSRVVLLTVTHLERTGETPAHTGEVIRASSNHLEPVEADTLGKVSEAEVSRALNRLDSKGFVEMVSTNNTSPVGKGRPVYTLDVDATGVLDDLADDPEVAPLVDQLTESDPT